MWLCVCVCVDECRLFSHTSSSAESENAFGHILQQEEKLFPPFLVCRTVTVASQIHYLGLGSMHASAVVQLNCNVIE